MATTGEHRTSGTHAVPRISALALWVNLALGTSTAFAKPPSFSPGAAGVGDPYFNLDGNGGNDVEHYSLDIRYDPESDHLAGVATIALAATQDLSSFNLDLHGLSVGSVNIDGHAAAWEQRHGELIITPRTGIRAGSPFSAVIEYGGVPETLSGDAGLRVSGFIHTNDGALIAGQPHVAATSFPCNDHPSDRASFTFEVSVPDGLQVVANGVLGGQHSDDVGLECGATAGHSSRRDGHRQAAGELLPGKRDRVLGCDCRPPVRTHYNRGANDGNEASGVWASGPLVSAAVTRDFGAARGGATLVRRDRGDPDLSRLLLCRSTRRRP